MTRRRLGLAVERLMADKTKATPQKEEARENGPETPDGYEGIVRPWESGTPPVVF